MNSITNTQAIDPRVLKELLQLQTMSKISLFSDDTSSANSDGTSDFSELLNTLMGQGIGTGTDVLDATELNPSLSKLPSALGALNKSFTPLQSTLQTTSVDQFEGLIVQASQKFGVDSSLVKAVIQQESSFNHTAVSSAGAKGLMQLMDGTSSGYGVTNPFDPKQNVEAGTQFLGSLLKKYNGNEGVALAAYNAGPGRIDRLGIKTDQDLASKLQFLPKETQAYVSKVLGHRNNFAL
ncbi:lytic transglycosylase domain-containing protein [Paenibacillus qinlingensis]|uniref:Soluble lytic murein transglycosylase-like protein n=1 Tax=Paenibacillus qinlingensis TaxID=1837343 RepID=A0ABU1NV36_9BACL|nr:lytic transglycosylase domain-containing protein [Paenibacillus qinlingensis]MDR6551341.1 soluble lytic murein transglycosylase-like protein [Paenibacillus qinlingensis]